MLCSTEVTISATSTNKSREKIQKQQDQGNFLDLAKGNRCAVNWKMKDGWIWPHTSTKLGPIRKEASRIDEHQSSS